jgi:hypothetical protein
VNRLNRLFSDNVGRRAIISVQNPIRLGERSEPQPDLALLRPCPDFYSPAHPGRRTSCWSLKWRKPWPIMTG